MKIYNVINKIDGLGNNDFDYEAVYNSGHSAGYDSGYTDAYNECHPVYSDVRIKGILQHYGYMWVESIFFVDDPNDNLYYHLDNLVLESGDTFTFLLDEYWMTVYGLAEEGVPVAPGTYNLVPPDNNPFVVNQSGIYNLRYAKDNSHVIVEVA